MTPKEKVEWRVQQLSIINAEYEEEKERVRKEGMGHSITIAIIERRHGLRRNTLRHYRINNLTPSGPNRNH